MIHHPLTLLQCSPTSDGAACAILCNEEFMFANGLQDQAVELKAIEISTDLPSSFQTNSSQDLVGKQFVKACAKKAYKKAGIEFEKAAEYLDVVELHDCFSTNELVTYEALGLCPEGKAHEYVDQDYFTYGGKVVVCPSGGLISKGHPISASGIAQCNECCWQLRGQADKR